MPSQTPLPALIESRRLASANGCYVIEKGARYLVYRKTPARPVFLGYRSTPEALRAFVVRLINNCYAALLKRRKDV